MASSRYSSYNDPPPGGRGGGAGSGGSGGGGGPGAAMNQLVDPESLYTKQGQIGALSFRVLLLPGWADV